MASVCIKIPECNVCIVKLHSSIWVHILKKYFAVFICTRPVTLKLPYAMGVCCIHGQQPLFADQPHASLTSLWVPHTALTY